MDDRKIKERAALKFKTWKKYVTNYNLNIFYFSMHPATPINQDHTN